jgi:hypothetical protein
MSNENKAYLFLLRITFNKNWAKPMPFVVCQYGGGIDGKIGGMGVV